MSGAGTVQCPHCGTLMDVQARFCPGCGTPRTWVREQLEREAAATGVPYEQLLERERRTGGAGLTQPEAGGWTAAPPTTVPAKTDRRRLWIILGTIGGILLLFCAGCVVASLVLINQFDVNLGDSREGDVVREQLELAMAGRHEERWQLLHPDQQLAVPVELFTTCAQYEGADGVEILFSFKQEDTFIPRIGDVDSRVVVYVIEDGSSTETDFFEMVEYDGEWRWTLADDDLRSFEAGRCP